MRRAGGALALALGALLAGCSKSTVGPGIRAEIHTGVFEPLTAANWVACTTAGCRFRAEGVNVGPDCVRGIGGAVRLETETGPVLDEFGNQIVVDWRLSPDPGAEIEANRTFAYETLARVPNPLIAAATHYTSVVNFDGFAGC